MPLRFDLRPLAVLGYLLSQTAVVSAQAPRAKITQQQIDIPAAIAIPCESAPSTAVVKMPAEVSRFARVGCTALGHFIIPAEGWVWKQPGSPAFFRINAQGDKPGFARAGHAAHFRSLKVTKLTAEQADAARRTFKIPAGVSAGPSVMMLTIESHAGAKSELFLFNPNTDYFQLGFSVPGKALTAYAASLNFVNK